MVQTKSIAVVSAKLTRSIFTDMQTLGVLELFEGDKKIFECKTLELPWRNNKIKQSCIPVGNYDVVPRTSPKFGEHFHVLKTEPRTWILFHAGNYYTQIEGCILVGKTLSDINGDGELDVTSSKVTLKALRKAAPEGFSLEIFNKHEERA